MPSPNDLVLITGSTGHVGFGVLRCALEHGYPVRAAARSSAKAQQVKDTIQSLGIKGHLEFTIIPDFTIPGAFDNSLENIKYIIHVASPLADPNGEVSGLQEKIIKPAIEGTLGLFESARKAGTIERIVVTSSVAAIAPLDTQFVESKKVYKPDDRCEELKPPFNNQMEAYCASKVATIERTEAWMKENWNEITFDAVHIHPSFVLGRDGMCKKLERFQEGTNFLPLSHALGIQLPFGDSRTNNINHVDDCAMVHVLSLDREKVPGNQSFIVSTPGDDGMDWNEVNEIVKRRFPEAHKSGIFPANGTCTSIKCTFDVSKTEKVFGFKHKGLEECVVSVCGHYLEILEREKGEEVKVDSPIMDRRV